MIYFFALFELASDRGTESFSMLVSLTLMTRAIIGALASARVASAIYTELPPSITEVDVIIAGGKYNWFHVPNEGLTVIQVVQRAASSLPV